MSKDELHITELRVENVQRIKAARIKPDGTLVVLGGDNGAGKTSILDAIMMGCSGGRSIPAKPIRDGADKGKVEIEVGDFTIRRTFTNSGSSLVVSTKDGARYDKPQKILDGLIGEISCDPLQFSRMAPKDQAASLRGIVGIDTTELDRERKDKYAERTAVNRRVSEQRSKLATMDEVDNPPDGLVELQGLANQLVEANKTNAAIDRVADSIEEKKDELVDLEAKIEALRLEIATETQELESLGGHIDTSEIEKSIQTIEQDNDRYRAHKSRLSAQESLKELEEESGALTKTIEEIDEKKAEMSRSAKYPIEGLAVTDDGVTYNGIPFEQSSQAEKLRVSCAIAMAMNPRLRVLLIRDASLLDDKSMAMIREMAESNDYQVWLERVGRGSEVTVIIEDGMIASDDGDGDHLADRRDEQEADGANDGQPDEDNETMKMFD